LTSSLSGVFTLEQATSGKQVFDQHCVGCHTATYLTGADFRKQWHGKTVWPLFEMIRQTMPNDNPRSLSDQQYALTVAYLLQAMRMPPGSIALPADSMGMKRIRIDTATTRIPAPRR
jgi:mono/diheme cytochrome c family protein